MDNLRRVEGMPQPQTLNALNDIAPDLADMAVGFVYGEIYTRPGLALRERQLATVAALAALGNAAPQLKFHLAGALNVGCTPTEVVEAMVHVAIYAGFPASLNALAATRDVFLAKGTEHEPQWVNPSASRYEDGWKTLQHIDGHAGERVIASLRDIAPDLGRFIIEFSFGDIYTRPGLGLIEREIVTIAALTALGTGAPQLKVHVHGLLNVGGTREQAVETVLQMAAYAGFPAAINGMLCVKDVLAERQPK
jgi:4-carboxymuconolactone decarboxylase